MTCAHVLGLIDAGPLVDYPDAHMENARAHARSCATCGPALGAAAALGTALAALPDPEPPAHLAAGVLARIARLDQEQRYGANVPAAEAPTPAVHGWHDGAAALAGVAACALVVLSIAMGEGPPVDLTSPRIGGIAGLGTQATAIWWITLAISLVLYVTALFAPLRAENAPKR